MRYEIVYFFVGYEKVGFESVSILKNEVIKLFFFLGKV